MSMIRGTVSEERAAEIIHHLAACHLTIRGELGLDAWDKAEFGKLIDAVKDEVARHTDARESST